MKRNFYKLRETLPLRHYERSDECIDFTMIITNRNNASISNIGGSFRWQSEYPWLHYRVSLNQKFGLPKKLENCNDNDLSSNYFKYFMS
ncbi:Uncharacterized protein FWK35_00031863 [Aphis craccivora]|uniref:Uncharacterized protein n=1 Tax=Aphis craccivora TaxID=307492 RepID=A0A6G0W3E8_APHCR|nr:Uncharacterized protein FWK35_00031863 [Aphis craccivora]